MRFNVLRIIADQFYYNVHDVRTKDDTLLNVKLMVFFELTVLLRYINHKNICYLYVMMHHCEFLLKY